MTLMQLLRVKLKGSSLMYSYEIKCNHYISPKAYTVVQAFANQRWEILNELD